MCSKSGGLVLVQRINLPVSWYEATAQRGAVVELRGVASVDVCVIGGGLAGLTATLELARAGKSVVLLEASQVACGASGRNGGFVSNGFALGIDDIVARVGLESAQKLHALSCEGTEYVRSTILQNDVSIIAGYGTRSCVRYNDGGGLHAYAEELREKFNEDVETAGMVETRALLDSPRYFDSISFPRGFHIHPLRYALLLKKLAQVSGAKIFENSRARSIEKSEALFVVRTDAGEVRAQHVVYCVSALDRQLHPPTGRAVLPVSTYVVVTEPLQQDAIRTSEAIGDTRRAGDYYRLIQGGRILWGGRITTRVKEPVRLAQSMCRDMVSTFPQLGLPRIDFAWAGLMGYALHKMPLIGRDEAGQWFATAFGGHGLNTTAMGGLLVARAIAFGADDYRRFMPFAPRWAFGQLGRLGVQGSYWWMQAKDRFDEATKTAIRR
jgi:gamma-glutamylputrescine oxidase